MSVARRDLQKLGENKLAKNKYEKEQKKNQFMVNYFSNKLTTLRTK